MKEIANSLLNLDPHKLLFSLRSTLLCGHLKSCEVYVSQLEKACNFDIRRCSNCGQLSCDRNGTIIIGAKLPGVEDSTCSGDNSLQYDYFVKSLNTETHCDKE